MASHDPGALSAPTEITYLTPEEVSERFRNRVSVRTLSNWRCLGTGPKYSKIGGRILYPLHEIETWETSRMASSTAGYVKAVAAALLVLKGNVAPIAVMIAEALA